MSSLLFERTVRFSVGYRHMTLQDLFHPDQQTGRRTGGETQVGVLGTGIVEFLCIGQLPDPVVHFEHWTAEPVGDERGAAYSGTFQGDVELLSDVTYLDAVTPTPDNVQIPTPTPGVYRVRAFRRPVTEHWQPSVTGNEDDPDRLLFEPEEWLIQMWLVEAIDLDDDEE